MLNILGLLLPLSLIVSSTQACLDGQDGCQVCVGESACFKCLDTWFLDEETKACISCPINCKTCSDDQTCLECVVGTV